MADGSPPTLPPHDLAAERATLGAELLRPDCIDDVLPIVRADDFYHPAHVLIQTSIVALHETSQPIDTVSVITHLRAVQNRLEAAGGPGYVSSLNDLVATSAHVEHHARTVAKLAQVRRVIAAGQHITALGQSSGPADVDAYCNAAANEMLTATESRSRSEPVHVLDALQLVYENIERSLARGSRLAGISSGIAELDALTAGLQNGQLIIDAARPKVGKTSLATHQCVECAKAPNGGPVLFFSLEMPRPEITARMLCQLSGVDFNRMRTNQLTQDDLDAMNDHGTALAKLPIWIDDDPCTSLPTIRSKARKRKRDGLALIVVDYLQIMETPEAETRTRELGLVTTGLKRLAKELEVPIMLLSQLNRAVENRGAAARPKLSDLRESGNIEQDADLVLMLHRPEMHDRNSTDKGVAEIIVAAQRNGPTGGVVRVGFEAASTRFVPLSSDDPRHDPPPEPDPPPRRSRGRRRSQRDFYPDNPEAQDAE